MYKLLAVLGIGLALSGCAVTKDGVKLGFGGTPSTSQVQEIRGQIEHKTESTSAKTAVEAAIAPQAKKGFAILVGTVGPLRKFDDGKYADYYAAYTKSADKWHPGLPAVLSAEEYKAKIGGWATVETFSIPGVIARRAPALVPKAEMTTIGFPSAFGSMMVGSTGDLVSARNNDDGMWVLEKVLCKDADAQYRTCAAQYERGQFDGVNGKELDSAFKPKDSGAVIDPATYKVVGKTN